MVSAEPFIQEAELPLTFPAEDGATIINFGLITGREATQAEIDRLAQLLNTEGQAGPDITIISSRRQDYGPGIETITHQIHVTVTGPPSPKVERLCRDWLLSCAHDRRVAPLDAFQADSPGSAASAG
jgi:hypothetical protein